MKAAISPCPNDTYLFFGWIAGLVGKELPLEASFADIQQLNAWALAKSFPLIKVSIATFSLIHDYYQLLPIGTALGYNCGPKIISKNFFPLAELKEKKVAVPGENTTAHLLLKRLLPNPKAKHFCYYHEVPHLIEKNEVDCGIIIHESRFTYKEAGFLEIADLGELWHQKMHSPLPLGGIAIARHLPDTIKREISSHLQASLEIARTRPEGLFPFILKHAQEKEDAIVSAHIHTYVNQETENISPEGCSAIKRLLNCALPADWLYSRA